MSKLTVEELRELSKKVIQDPDAVYNLDPEEAVELRKHINPYGGIVSAKKTYVNMSLINWKDLYLRKFYMTSLVGYIYRTLEEYQPEEEFERENKKYNASIEELKAQNLDPDSHKKQFDTLTKQHNDRKKLMKSTAQGIIKRFLNRNFNFNPDIHLQSAHSSNDKDPERKPKDEAIREKCALAAKAPEIETKLQGKQDKTYEYLRAHLLSTYQVATQVSELTRSIINVIADPQNDVSDKQGILVKKYKTLTDTVNDIKKIAEPLASADTLNAWKVDPPVNIFHSFDRYIVNHYEQLREVCQAVYNEKPDFEYSVIVYDAFKSAEAARNYRIQHESEFRTEVLTIENNSVTLVGPFKENRERVDFYNKNVDLVKRLMEQVESDHKLGGDLMKKKVRTEKKKNIEEAGPDDPALAQYAKTMNIAQELGAKKVLTKEEQQQIAEAHAKAQAIKEDYEVPDDAIQVDVFYPTQDAEGNSAIAKTKFYTQAEAPLFMQEGSQYVDKYQPVREEGQPLVDSYKTKVITGRNGEKREIQVPITKKDEDSC